MTVITEKKTVAICETQPITAEGVRGIIDTSSDLAFVQWLDSLAGATDYLRQSPPDIVMIDKAFRIQAILDWLAEMQLRKTARHPSSGVSA